MRLIYFTLFLFLLSACSLAIKIKTGAQAFDLKHYSLAAELLEAEYQQAKSKDDKLFILDKLVASHKALNQYSQSYKWLREKLNYVNDPTELYNFAYAAKSIDSIRLAKRVFQDLYKQTKDRSYVLESNLCDDLMTERNKAIEIEIENLEINSDQSDYGIQAFEDGYYVFVSSNTNTSNDVDPGTGQAHSDLFMSNKKGDYAYPFSGALNTKLSEGAFCFSTNYDRIYFTRCESDEERDVFCRIYQSDRVLGEWTRGEPILFFPEATNVGHPAYMERDSILIFSVNSSDGHDLYYSIRGERQWTLPEKMPDIVNSSGREMFPNVKQDTLYFSSDRKPGYGGLDIYKTYLNNEGFWTEPTLLKPPSNSGADDFNFLPIKSNDDVTQFFISSNRVGGKGFDDIYKITVRPSQLALEEKEEEADPDLAKVNVVIRVIDANNSTLPGVALNLKGTTLEKTLKTNNRGFAVTEIKRKDDILITTNKSGFFAESKSVKVNDPRSYKRDTTIQVDIKLSALEIGKEIVLEDIFYDLDKWDIRDDAKPSLDGLSDLLVENETLVIELGAHTDCRASDEYNLELSEKRAASAVQYLVNKGISQERMITKGYGESSPRSACICEECSEEQHQLNRRTSFTILSQ